MKLGPLRIAPWLLLGGVAACRPAPVSAPPTARSASAALGALVARAEARPGGGGRADLPEISFAKVRRDADSARTLLSRLDSIQPGGLSHEEQLTQELLRWEARKAVGEEELYWYTFLLLPAISPLRGATTLLAGAPLVTPADRQAYLDLLERCAALVAGMKEKSARQAEKGIVLPREQIDNVLPYLRAFAQPADRSPFRIPEEKLRGLSAEEVTRFHEQVARGIEGQINPAMQDLVRYVEELRPRAPAEVGIGQYPGGKEAYRALVKRETTLDVTPEEVHEIGLRALDAIEARMQQVRDSLGFKGTKAEFHEQLRRDRRFYVQVADSVGRRLMAYIQRIEPRLLESFSRRPKAPYGARRLDPALEPSMTYGYYNFGTASAPTGYYNFNGSDLDQRSLLMAGAIAYHELVPGHHFQINLARENESLPRLRRYTMHAGYTEGWGEYSSSVVASEMGMYRDAYEIYGRLVFDGFFAVRLVVDTGMNYFGWSRARAMEYMKEHTLESDVQIDSETLRYSTRSPAQALAYRMGRETFVNLRRKAERELGPKFDVRRFHDALLMSGSLPLFLLERHVDWWIEQQRSH